MSRVVAPSAIRVPISAASRCAQMSLASSRVRNYGVSTPVFSGGRVFMSVGQDPDNPNGIGHTYCIDPARRGDISESGRVWQYDKIRRSVSTAAVADGLVYVSDLSGILDI